ncbi:hypothetical protein JOF53_006380 [Crossiella equi]|uniref:Peptidase S1 domain-containing protein n=1 Tax=Crossiella equi TaxID=130796 RepID=A0ABS5ALS3_9PSEU|nr:AbfB domain-containing protein [Crossiella equi]MBP2477508.1 hypothetical protein [Crossiella equi]
MSRTRSRVTHTAVLAAAFALFATPAHAITGGSPVAPGQHDYVTAFDQGERRCTATLIDPQWVLSTASCFDTNPDQAGVQVTAGRPPRRITLRFPGKGQDQVVDVVDLAPRAERDVLMGRLSDPVHHVAPAAIGTTPPAVGEVLQAVGFGRTATQPRPEVPHAAPFTVTGPVGETFGLTGGAAICDGDLGGPALRVSGGRAELLGVHASSGQAGCPGQSGGTPGATETRVDDLRPWIEQTIAEGRKTPGLETGNIVQLTGVHATKCLDVFFARWEAGTKAVIAGCHGRPNQRWEVRVTGANTAMFRSMNNKGMCLDLIDGLREGSRAGQSPCDEQDRGQWWEALPAAAGAVELRNAAADLVLQAASFATAEGSDVTAGTNRHEADQHWTLSVVGRARHDLTQPGDDRRSIRATNPGLADHFVRHRDGLGFLSFVTEGSSDLERKDATFRLVPGRANAHCYSLESAHLPGNFLRHANGRLRLDGPSGDVGLFNADATWCARDGLSSNGVSFESWNFPDKFLRHINGELWLAQQDGSNWWENKNNFHHDTSWDPVRALRP